MAQKNRASKPPRSKNSPGWHVEDIKAAIRKKGSSLTELAQTHEYSDSYLRGTLIRRRPRGEAIIADFLEVAPAEIWPERYKIRAKRNVRSKKSKP